MNVIIRREIKKHVRQKKEIKSTDLLVREVKKEIKKHQIKHVIK